MKVSFSQGGGPGCAGCHSCQFWHWGYFVLQAAQDWAIHHLYIYKIYCKNSFLGEKCINIRLFALWKLLLFLFFQFVTILEGVLAKLSRYDEGTLFSSFLSFTVS